LKILKEILKILTRQKKIQTLAKALEKSQSVFESVIKSTYGQTNQSKLRSLRKEGDLNYQKMAELILKKKKEIDFYK